jgi:hypothetical protein
MTSSRRCRLYRHYRLSETTCPLGQNFALEDPTLDADGAIGGVRFGRAILDVGAERV